jgi:hypothetical protein
MRWGIVAGLSAMVIAAIVWDGRHDEYQARRAWGVVTMVLVGAAILAAAVFSGWVTGSDVY